MRTCPPFLLDFNEERLFKGKSKVVVVSEGEKRVCASAGRLLFFGALASESRDNQSRPACHLDGDDCAAFQGSVRLSDT